MTTRSWTRSAVVSLSAFALSLALLASVAVSIDSLGVWRESEKGWNHVKPYQLGVQRVFKPLQHGVLLPDVVFFGSSRVSYGLPAEMPGTSPERVYNYSLNSTGIDEVLRCLEHVLLVHPPKHIVLGLDPWILQLKKEAQPYREWGYDPVRNRAIQWGLVDVMRVRDSMLTIDALAATRQTVRASANKNALPFYVRGYRVNEGEKSGLLREQWKRRTYLYARRVKHWHVDQPRLDTLVRRVKELREKGIRVDVALIPDFADLAASWSITPDARKRFLAMKRQLAEVGLWDFQRVDDWTRDPKNFRDAAHMNGRLGRAVLQRIAGGDGPGVFLESTNVEAALEDNQQRAAAYLEENPEYALMLMDRRIRGEAFSKRLEELRPFLRRR